MSQRTPRGRSGKAGQSGVVSLALRFVKSPFGKVFLGLTLIVGVAGLAVFNHYWWEYAKIVDAKLVGGPFNRTAKILAAADPIFVDQELTLEEILVRLREAGYSDSRHNSVGHFIVKDNAVEIYPGPLSYFAQEPAVVYFGEARVTRIVSLNDNTPQTAYELEPELVTHVFDDDRSKRRVFRYEDYPQVLVDAVVAIEDHRFFSHHGIDILRTTKAALDGLIEGRQPRGTSTLTQQLARNFFLMKEFLAQEDPYQRKLAELMIAWQLEMRLSKEQIFEYYANQVSMGRSGSFNVMGMGEAARAYFDKDLRDVTLAEAALLAGLPQGPSYLNPYRHPERAINRREQVLRAMLREGFIDDEAFAQANAEELHLAEGHIETSAAPYYVDLVSQNLREHFDSDELITQDYWIYTTLDRNLQKAAVEAVRIGMEEVDQLIAKQRRFQGVEPPRAQAALVALDPKTGEVKAIVGGRDYGESQLNRVLAKRQPGSVFKPFVYAAAIDTALDADRAYLLQGFDPETGKFVEITDAEGAPVQQAVGEPAPIVPLGDVEVNDDGWPVDEHGWPVYPAGEVYTAASLVDDVPTTFWYDGKPYEPANHLNKITGLITFRYALRRSINIAAVKVAEMAGYERVMQMAQRANLGDELMPTPAMALGAYEATPLQIAGAYTALVNGGVMKKPYFVRMVRNPQGRTLFRREPEDVEVMDPRVAYITTNMLEDVINRGTGIAARVKYDFREPAAGKTGTDDDGWFAGFTNNLLCVVWVGFDDNVDLSLEGAHSALPIWTEFMKQAHALRAYKNPPKFEAPDGVVTVEIDPDTQELATHACPDRIAEVFIAGSQPSRFCSIHGGGGRITLATNVAGWDNGPSEPAEEPNVARRAALAEANSGARRGASSQSAPVVVPLPEEAQAKPKDEKKKSGFFGRVLGIFK